MSEEFWRLERGDGPLLATAVHDGHFVRPEVAALQLISASDRLREEDPFTGLLTAVAPTRVIGRRSRFEVDLNRPRGKAVYRVPEDAWGLEIWKRPPPEDLIAQSLAIWESFYADMRTLMSGLAEEHGSFVVYDLHSYNHHRLGPTAPYDDPSLNPVINVGTSNMDRARWAPVIDAFSSAMAQGVVQGHRLDVRENVRFRGGEFSRWIHRTFPNSGCSISIEFKKIFMDEWSGEPDRQVLAELHTALAATVEPVLAALERVR